ncbi:hypothetical protein O181_089483 [Austropuccinia psidii MF-1]|uniref:Uncharacterized protein n=1 Tax=Austropuccinia psidii MF-1 TaxID=1389203 RepID=A0A9Q3P4T8_9BASI|nr:hypothetical protein [Austropuccinia psidii MF-1]
MGPPESKAFQRLSLLMKDISIVTSQLSKMMTSNYSLNDSTSHRRGKKPKAHSEAWKKNHSQGECCSYGSLSLRPTANLQSRSPRTTKDFNLKFFRCTGSQSCGKEEKTMATKKKKYKSNFKDTLATNTSYRTASIPKAIDNSTMTKEIITKEEYDTHFDSKSTNANTIKANSNLSIQKRTKTMNDKRTLSSNQLDTNNNEIYNIKEEKSRPTTSRASSRIDEIKLATIDTTVNKNEETTILNKIVNYIERKIKNQPIPTKGRVSTTLKNITTYIDNRKDIYHLLNSDNHIDNLYISTRDILKGEKCSEGILNKDKLVILKYFIYSTTDRNNFYHTDKNIQEIITKIQKTYTIYYK